MSHEILKTNQNIKTNRMLCKWPAGDIIFAAGDIIFAVGDISYNHMAAYNGENRRLSDNRNWRIWFAEILEWSFVSSNHCSINQNQSQKQHA